MTFDRIDRMFAAKPRAMVVLECVNCGSTQDVSLNYPLWQTVPCEMVPLCQVCSIRRTPTDHE